MLATVSGVADVDAITLSLARMSQGELTSRVAVMAIFIGGGRIGLRVSVPLLASAVIGLLATWFLVWCASPITVFLVKPHNIHNC